MILTTGYRVCALVGALVAACCSLVVGARAAGAAPPAREAIVGGVPAGNFPAQAAILIEGQYHCGGTLVAPTKVVTAAHCVYDDDGTLQATPAKYDIVLGAHNDPIFGSDAERSHLDTWTITRFGVSFPIRSMTSTPITMTPR